MGAGRKLDAAPVRTPAAASGASVSRSVASVLASRRGRKRRSCRALMLLHEPAAVDLADESVILGRAMSLENVELVRQLYEAAERRDLETLEMLGSEEGEFHSVLAASEGRVFRGRQGIRDYFAAIDAAFGDWQPEIEELIDAGDDRVVALIHVSGRGKASGIPLHQRVGQIVTVRENRICFIDSYFNQSEALAAAGLRE
jgi:ketosteroid isomerase-like protein